RPALRGSHRPETRRGTQGADSDGRSSPSVKKGRTGRRAAPWSRLAGAAGLLVLRSGTGLASFRLARLGLAVLGLAPLRLPSGLCLRAGGVRLSGPGGDFGLGFAAPE